MTKNFKVERKGKQTWVVIRQMPQILTTKWFAHSKLR